MNGMFSADPNALYHMAQDLHRQGHIAEAVQAYEQLIGPFSDEPDLRLQLGVAFLQLNRPADAIPHLRACLHLVPNQPLVLTNLGTALQNVGQIEDAIDCLRKAVTLAPRLSHAWNNLGNAQLQSGRREDALNSFNQALRLDPGYAFAYYNRGCLQVERMHLPEAIADFQKTRALQPDFAQAGWNEALAHLLSGNFTAGWPLYSLCWENPELRHPDWMADVPVWRGEALEGRTLIIRKDQGFGDYIQFCRLAHMAQAQGAEVIVSAPAPLIRLLQSLKGVRVVAEGAPLPEDALHSPIINLPQFFAVQEETIPSAPYLAADTALRETLHATLGRKTRPRIGLAISGSTDFRHDATRSIPLDMWQSLLALPCDFYLVQKGLRAQDEISAARWANLHQPVLTDFADTAALIAEMDLTISVDSAPAHVAGAIGAPVWILLTFSPDWRWMTGRDDSPWYPSAKLFRQPAPDGWPSVLHSVTAAVQQTFINHPISAGVSA